MLKKSDECAVVLLMARVGAIAPGKTTGYFARRSGIELVALDAMVLAGALTMVASRIHQPAGVAGFLFAAPGLALIVRSLVSALAGRDACALRALRPDHVPIADAATEAARRLARAGVIALAAPLAPGAMVVAVVVVVP